MEQPLVLDKQIILKTLVCYQNDKNEFRKMDYKEKLKEILIVSFCISMGTLSGVLSLFIFYYCNIAIFGYNLGLLFSPLIAGYIEIYLARRIHGKTTGAISAFILFIITVIYGFILANNGLGFNLVTIGSLAIILQSTFPILAEYLIILILFGLIAYLTWIFKNILSHIKNIFFKLINYTPKDLTHEKNIKYNPNIEHTDINDLGILFLSTTHTGDNKIREYKGIFESKIIIHKTNKFFTNSSNSQEVLDNLRKATEQAILNLSVDLKKKDCNGLLDFTIEYDTVGNFGDANQIVVRGTGIHI
ncbi:MAG: hypothetical protein LBB45_07480 [Methanobrevibacter sp.]|jgi:uncharacterized protein YbjQ (UPF0145 family)|nr:hypothetical protein [Candidatus Methanovirga basalitermitum]